DRGIPVMDRLLHAFLVRTLADLSAGIVPPVGDHRPAIVLAGFRHVDLIAAARAVLDDPKLTARRIDRRSLRIAMAVRPDLRPHAILADERIVLRHRSVRRETHDLAEMAGKILRRLHRVAFAERDE